MSHALHLPVAILQQVVSEEEFQEYQAFKLIELTQETLEDIRFSVLMTTIVRCISSDTDIEPTYFLGLIQAAKEEVLQKYQDKLHVFDPISQKAREEEKERLLMSKFEYLAAFYRGTGRIKE